MFSIWRLQRKRRASPDARLLGPSTKRPTDVKVAPEDDPTSQSLRKGGEDSLKSPSAPKGAAFDKGHMEHEIGYQGVAGLVSARRRDSAAEDATPTVVIVAPSCAPPVVTLRARRHRRLDQ